jgi:hypothetical protein
LTRATDTLLSDYAAARRAEAEERLWAMMLEANLEASRLREAEERKPKGAAKWLSRGLGRRASSARDRDEREQRPAPERWQAAVRAEEEKLQAARRRAAEHAEAAVRVEQELRRCWVEEGRQLAELTKRLRQTDYAETVQALFRGVVSNYDVAVKEQKSLASELRAFWVTSGHDLDELDRFLASVDARALELVPK